jgi:hypothetical protein
MEKGPTSVPCALSRWLFCFDSRMAVLWTYFYFLSWHRPLHCFLVRGNPGDSIRKEPLNLQVHIATALQSCQLPKKNKVECDRHDWVIYTYLWYWAGERKRLYLITKNLLIREFIYRVIQPEMCLLYDCMNIAYGAHKSDCETCKQSGSGDQSMNRLGIRSRLQAIRHQKLRVALYHGQY